jgi:signal transduction histidine kinase
LLSRVADLSRELVDAMGEIVWAMNPQRDKLADVIQRMRRFASDVLVARGIEFEFQAPQSDLDLPLRSDVRRNLYLVFKEGINNIVRHSGCTQVTIALSADKEEMKLHLADNGRGVLSDNGREGARSGRGLASMKERAAALGGPLEITSSPGAGTRLFLRVPFVHRTFRAKNTT